MTIWASTLVYGRVEIRGSLFVCMSPTTTGLLKAENMLVRVQMGGSDALN